mmetsp:Transcript_106331/g.266358  ORF Transcript_106331/g.266358 Transcript_106331/m.266358 type:complete len:83 (+) Transcript_106331:1012-1260(+)
MPQRTLAQHVTLIAPLCVGTGLSPDSCPEPMIAASEEASTMQWQPLTAWLASTGIQPGVEGAKSVRCTHARRDGREARRPPH